MDAIISDLVDRYEKGRLSRRELIGGLSALAAAGGGAGQAFAQAAPALKPTGIDHVSILVSDLQRSAEFYKRVFDLNPVSEDAANKILRLAPSDPSRPNGSGRVLVSLRQTQPVGTTDHWSFRVQGFNQATVTETLTRHGLTPTTNVEYGFHVRDPDGVVVQVV